MRSRVNSVLIAVLAPVVFGTPPPANAGQAVQEAIATIQPVKGQKVAGTIKLVPTGDGLKITGELSNLEPGAHGFHVHRYGNCTAPNDGSVGPHFSPLAGGEGYHGDLPQVEAAGNGEATYEAKVKTLAFDGEYSVIGRAMVIHALNGDKIGCGVIGIAR